MSTKNLRLSQSIDGMLFYKRASGKSPNTISDYRNCFSKLALYLPDDPPLASITRDQLVSFFAWLRDDYISEPGGAVKRAPVSLGPKSILNVHTALSALWTWAMEEGLAAVNPIHSIEAPKVPDTVIETFTKEQIEKMLEACERNKWKSGRATSERPTGDRDRAIVLALLDTGLRAQEWTR